MIPCIVHPPPYMCVTLQEQPETGYALRDQIASPPPAATRAMYSPHPLACSIVASQVAMPPHLCPFSLLLHLRLHILCFLSLGILNFLLPYTLTPNFSLFSLILPLPFVHGKSLLGFLSLILISINNNRLNQERSSQ